MPAQYQIQLFRSLFKGREEVFAVRWEKGKKSGYMPAYSFDPYFYRAHRIKGGSFRDFQDKSYLALTDEQLLKHFNGTHHIGLYPLLPDNTSWFIAADFDKGDWLATAGKFIQACTQKGIAAYLERSRSGNGGHVWIFFNKSYPAYKSRRVMLDLLVSSGAVSAFDKSTSFDRLFPNQDHHSGKGLGNLIALPLNGQSTTAGNSCFIDPSNGVAYDDQWSFLKKIDRVNTTLLDTLFDATHRGINQAVIPSDRLIITLDNRIRLNRHAINQQLFRFIKDELNFPNKEFIIKRKSGRSTFGSERYFRFIEEKGAQILLPRGFAGKLLRFCKKHDIPHELRDERKQHPAIPFSFGASLQPQQEECLQATRKKEMGVIVAPPGSGKTVTALKIISEKSQPALIVVHRRQLAQQWKERVEAFLGIPSKDVGKIESSKARVGSRITIATIQRLSRMDIEPIRESFGTIIIDECHHVPAETFRNTISAFNSRYLYGLTATPIRKYGDHPLIFIHLGECIAEIAPDRLGTANTPRIIIRNTQLVIPFNPKTDRFETLSKILVHDSERNRLIISDIVMEVQRGNKVVVLTERKEHIDSLGQFLKQSFETVMMSGEDSVASRKEKWRTLNDGNYQVLLTTGQFFGEGSDLRNVQCLFLVYPFSFEGKLIQYIRRVQRSAITPTIYDYRDIKVDYLNRMFLKRNIYYRKLEKQRSLFDFPADGENVSTPDSSEKETVIQKDIKVKIEDLDFLYGGFQFEHNLSEHPSKITFDIENLNIRPEFEVLKPYFAKLLKTKYVTVHITVILSTMQGLMASEATSEDLATLNRDIIEGVRFRFLEKRFFGKKLPVKSSSVQQNLPVENGTLYDSGEELLADVLKRGKYRHAKHLQYLANLHEGNILKLRFVLTPFAFVFLLAGRQQYHVIMETLDTEEATYLWHFPKSTDALKRGVVYVDNQLERIRTEGRQSFLESKPEDFSKIIHDYTDDRKGFVLWKDALEERLW